MPDDGRLVLPQDVEAEKCILGAAILYPESVASMLEALKADDFYLGKHKTVFTAIEALFSSGDPVDQVLLRNKLVTMGVFDEIGGSAFLGELWEYASAAPNLDKYIDIVKQMSVLRSLISATLNIQSSAYRHSEPATEILEQAERAIYQISSGTRTNDPEHVSDILTRVLVEQIDDSNEANAKRRVVFTNYYSLDEMTTGFHPGELIIIAGRPGMGKSSLLLSMAVNIARSQDAPPIAFYSLEMSREQCTSNMLCGLAKVPVEVLRKRRGISREYRDVLMESADLLSEYPIMVDDSASLTPVQLRSRARRLRSQHNIAALFIDYLQLMQGGGRFDSRQAEVAEISRSLKLLAKELGIPIIAGSQISREAAASKDSRPKLHHLRESGAIEQDADVVILMHRDDYGASTVSSAPSLTELILAKQRNGPTGTVKLNFIRQYTRFENCASDSPTA